VVEEVDYRTPTSATRSLKPSVKKKVTIRDIFERLDTEPLAIVQHLLGCVGMEINARQKLYDVYSGLEAGQSYLPSCVMLSHAMFVLFTQKALDC